jgi:hypothetical protein
VPVSIVAPFADRIKAWFGEGVQGVATHVVLVRDHGFNGCNRRREIAVIRRS